MNGAGARPRGASRLPPAVLGVAIVALGVSAGAQVVSVAPIVARASRYVAVFVDRFSGVVAEERYVQTVRRSPEAFTRRESVADLLLVKGAGTAGWTVFRDVFEVNSTALRDHDERLTKLFLTSPSTANSQAEAITRESASQNIGTPRTVNNPLLPLAWLQDAYRPRFSFSLDSGDRSKMDGRDVWVVKYVETGRPTLIRGRANGDLPAHGRYWIDDESGLVLKAELEADDASVKSKIVVTYHFDERFRLGIPVQMDEEYTTRSEMTRATAKYDRFRLFEVKTEERAR